MPRRKPSNKASLALAPPRASPLIAIAWPAAQVAWRDELLDGIVRTLPRRPATRAMAKRIARALKVLRGVEAKEGARIGFDSAARLVAVARDQTARIEAAAGQ